MFWGAEIEIYRLARSNGSPGYFENSKNDSMILDFTLTCSRHFVDRRFVNVLVSQMASKVQTSSQEIDFCSNFDQNVFPTFFFFAICQHFGFRLCHFCFCQISFKKLNFSSLFIIFVPFLFNLFIIFSVFNMALLVTSASGSVVFGASDPYSIAGDHLVRCKIN